jgi:hypothetical protein
MELQEALAIGVYKTKTNTNMFARLSFRQGDEQLSLVQVKIPHDFLGLVFQSKYCPWRIISSIMVLCR